MTAWTTVAAGQTQQTVGEKPRQELPAAPEWEKAAGGHKEFDAATVKPSAPGGREAANFPLGPGDIYSPAGGTFSARNIPLFAYITFAYKATANQTILLRSRVPDWVLTTRFDIEAHVAGNPTKDQMRLMMQALLADRFDLALYQETGDGPVFALVPLKPGQTGPGLRAHVDDPGCSTDPRTPSPPSTEIVPGGTPVPCGGLQLMPPNERGGFRLGGRNVSMPLIANSLSSVPNGPELPVLDKTGLTGTFDFAIEYVPHTSGDVGGSSQPTKLDATFTRALAEQLGLKLVVEKGTVQILVMDHIEPLSRN